jgi:uncharacterized protein YdeI (YjbR/CyaY-like superfamily)
MTSMEVVYFESAAAFRDWLLENHNSAKELWVGFRKKGSGLPSITYPEAVDEALCVGWIDGVRKSVDRESYTTRFTPRRPRSIWSTVNLKRYAELTKLGRVQPSGIQTFESRDPARSGLYAFENRPASLPEQFEARFKQNAEAWAFFQSRPPWYQRTAIWWIVSAKRRETQEKRLETLIKDSAAGETIGPLTRPGGHGSSTSK